MRIIRGTYFHQHNIGDGDKMNGDGVGMKTSCVEMGGGYNFMGMG